MTNKYILLFLLAMTFLMSACRKDFDNTTITTEPVKFIQSSIHGAIHDSNNRPVMNALVKKGNLQTVTDSNGYFYLLPSPCDQNGVPVHISANGYFSITKTVIPSVKGGTQLFAELTPRILNATIPSSQGGIVEVQGASIKLPENGFVTSSGQPYSGPVQVYATFLNPNDQNMQLRMPGNLTAVRTDGRAAVLATFGMLGVELRSPAGAELNLAAGKEAEISIPLSGAYAASAPSEIPLWHFDNASGKWREEGKATMQGNKYVGKVSHFSFWNVDIPFVTVLLSGTITDNDGIPVQGVVVKLTVVSGTASGFPPGSMANAVTNQEGYFSGFVPANSELLLEVVSQCNTVIHSQNIGSFTSNTVLPNIVLQSGNDLQAVEGSLVDCDQNPLNAPSYIKIEVGNKVFFFSPEADGSIQAILSTCGENILKASGFDPINLKQSQVVQYNIPNDGSTLDLGLIEVCDQLEEYISVVVDGFTYTFSEVAIQSAPSADIIYGNSSDSSIFTMYLNDFDAPAPAVINFYTVTRDIDNDEYYNASCQGLTSCSELELNITENGGVGGFLGGNFNGSFMNGTTTPTEVSGTFRVRIE
ncbi:MAG: carboxypeptidase regulatory-like domain-containing protein [Saprospiraceae bacterium]|nr:carboxypeptidase regulatory-like domain-containing protein [Saprospiraceae bacterium]